MTQAPTPEDLAKIAGRLSEAQRALLLRYEPVLTDQRVETCEEVYQCAFYVQITPDEFDTDDGFLLWPGEKHWFASGMARSPEGSATFDECSIRYNETGLALRNYLETNR